MKILRLRADGFGPLRGEWTFSPDRLNLVVDDNERGKSSLLAAIAAALYGLDADRRTHRVLTPQERWRPWDGGAYRVELEFEAKDQRWMISRDLERGTVSVLDGGGRDVTADFREGKDEYPVGLRLLGLDMAEFEKCALVRQGDLEQVVPGDERQRRGSTLRARLENAADTHIGDTNATEAIRVLEDSLRRYNAPELEFTGTVDTAIERLQAKRDLLESELKTLEHDLAAASEPLERLAALADEEQSLKDKLRALEVERHEGLAAEVRRQLAENDRALAELQRLREEADGLAAAANLPANAEADLRETVARYEEAQRNLDTLETRRRDEMARERRGIEAQLSSLKPYADYSEDETNRCVAIASELRRMTLDDAQLRQEVFTLRDQLAAAGYEPERIQYLTGRFVKLPEDSQKLLRQQQQLNLAFQTEVAELEQERTEATETLRNVDASRNARRLPGWVMLALGIGAAIGGGAMLAMHTVSIVAMVLLGGGAALAATGGGLLAIGARAQSAERDAALKRLSDAQRRLNHLRTRRAENEVALSELARSMNYRDQVDLLAQWTEYTRLLEDSTPLTRAQEQLSALEQRRRSVMIEAQPLMRGMADGTPAPEHLEKVAYEARRAISAKQRLAELDEGWAWVEEERRVAEATAAGLKERALRILQSAGLTYDPERSWTAHVEDLATRVRSRSRFTLLRDELIPYAESRLLTDSEVEQRRRHLSVLEDGRAEGERSAAVRPPEEVDAEAKQARTRLEEVQSQRADLRLEVEEVWRRSSNQRPEIESQMARMAAALERAKRFKQAAEMARTTIQEVAVDTHRRWADYLNSRVADLLGQFGNPIHQLRFGEDLDFSIQTDEGPQVSRGKAHIQLSAGARDQLYLAVRLAISEFLSRGAEPLPLLLDDAFATSDDDRLKTGMTALLDGFGTGHQIIAVTCHRSRHDELRRLDPERFIGRVQWIEVGAGAHVRG